MTMISAYAKGRRGLLVTDTACYVSDGTVTSFQSKVMTLPRLRMAIASRGAVAALPAFASDIEWLADSFDELIEAKASIIEMTFDHNVMNWSERANSTEFDLFAIGWSERAKSAQVYAISSVEHEGRPAFTWWRQDFLFAPAVPRSEIGSAGLLLPNGNFDDRDPDAMLLKLAHLQRAMPSPIGTAPNAPLGHIVGGELISTEVTEHGISQRTIHRWADQLDRPIDPSVGKAASMSKEQRRRLAQQEKRLAKVA